MSEYCKNCYELAEQLHRKTQECEELKAYAQRQENQREVYYKEYLKLSQECEELKKQIKQLKDTIKREKEAGYSIIERLL